MMAAGMHSTGGKRMRVVRHTVVAALVAAAALMPVTIQAQGVTYHSTSKFDMGGALGALAKFGAKAGGAGGVQTTYISGHRMATVGSNASTIIDVDAGRFITINNREKTYTSATFEEMAQYLDQAAKQADESRKQAAAKEKEKEKEKASPEVKLDYAMSVDRTPETEKIAGYTAHRQFITLTMTATPTDQAKRDSAVDIVVLMDVWTTNEGPAVAASTEFRKAYAARVRSDFRSPMRSFEMLLGGNPGMKSALQAAGKEMEKVQGLALRSTTYIVGVPPGLKFDRQQVTGGAKSEAKADEPKQEKKGGFFGKLKAAAEQVQKAESQQGQQKEAKQGTLLSFGTEIQDIQTGVPSGVFSIPAGYREVKLEAPRQR